MISGDQMGMVGGYGTGHDEKNRDFFGRNISQLAIFVDLPFVPPPSTLTTVQRDRYSGPDMCEKCFQLFFIFIV